ncbi:MAG: peroxiredoxin-like family protein [Gaiellaceae bacterium]
MKVLSQKPKLDGLGATALFVVHDDPAVIRGGLLDGLDVPYPVLVDRERAAYRDWGLQRSSRVGVWLDPRVWARYAALMARGERLRPLGRDTLQLGGDFVVDPDGIVTYARPQRRDDRPPVSVLVDELRAASRAQ